MKTFFEQIRFEIFLIFILLEVILFESQNNFQLFFSFLEYLFVTSCFSFNKRNGIFYFILFTLLSLAGWTYVVSDSMPSNFWGVRLFGFSFNILFSIYLAVSLLIDNKISIRLIVLENSKSFFFYFIIYSTLVGLFHVYILENSYLDNFIKDFLIFTPFFIYYVLLSSLTKEDVFKIIHLGIIFSLILMVLSILFKKYFEYGGGYRFILLNSFGYISIFTFLLYRPFFKKSIFIFCLILSFVIYFSGNLFYGSKSLVIIFILIFWYFIFNFRKYLFLTLSFFVLVFIFSIFNDLIFSKFSDENLFYYKFLQVYSVFQVFDFDILAKSNTSIGNIFSEVLTLKSNIASEPITFFFGKGFGGAIYDNLGYLSIYVGEGLGYSSIDLSRNQFTRMHLPSFEIIIKSGLIGFLFYLQILFKSFSKYSVYSISFFILFLTVFTNSKEMLLLTILFDFCSNKVKYNNSS